MKNKKKLWREYLVSANGKDDGTKICGLCRNSGIMIFSSEEKEEFCICPNGRMIKKISKKEK